MAQNILIRAGDTEALTITVDAGNLSNLDNVQTAALYMRERGASSNHIDGASLTVTDSANRELSFDPVGAKVGGGDAFDVPGVFRGYVVLTHSDGTTTRHPSETDLGVTVIAGIE